MVCQRLLFFVVCHANVTPIPKCPPTFTVVNYRSISITPVQSKVFDLSVSVRLGRFMDSSDVLPTTQFVNRQGPVTCSIFLFVSHITENILKCGLEARIVLIDCSAAIDTVKHQETLFKLSCLGE